jgi:hypothetical protein
VLAKLFLNSELCILNSELYQFLGSSFTSTKCKGGAELPLSAAFHFPRTNVQSITYASIA